MVVEEQQMGEKQEETGTKTGERDRGGKRGKEEETG